MNKWIIASLCSSLAIVPAYSACTATERNADYAEKSSLAAGPVTSSKNVPIAAAGDMVLITAWCHNPLTSPVHHCTVAAPTLGGVTATLLASGIPSDGTQDSGVTSGTGQGWLYYIPSTTSGMVGSSTSLSLTASIVGGTTETQVSYMEFSPSAGCSFVPDTNYFGTSLDPVTGLDKGTASGTINQPVFTPRASDLLFDFMYTTEHINTIGSPWSCVIYPGITGANNTCEFNSTINSQAYVLSAAASSTNPNTTLNATNNWQAIVASFSMSATYYVSKSTGLDSRTSAQAGSKATPWAHTPGMTGCTGNCAAYTPVAGDRFILMGGDIWLSADLGINWTWNGSSGKPIYIGVDQAWFSGASWVRPIFNLQNTMGASNQFGNVVWLAGNFTVFDNIEITGYQQSSGGYVIGAFGNDNEISNNYIHGFSRTAGSSGSNSFAITNNFSSGGALRTNVHNNVIDGSDSPNQDFMGGILHGDIVRNNVIRYVYNGMNGLFNVIDGNLVEHNYVSTSGDHCNMVFPQNTFTGSTLVVSNNVIRHAACSGGVTLFTMGNSSCTTCTAYVYNNVLYDNEVDSDKGISTGSHVATGTYYVYNNTVDTPGGSCMGNGEAPPRSTAHYANNHCISPNPICLGTGTTCVNDGNNLSQTESQANTAGYNASQAYAYSPTSGSSPTVGAGLNATSLCAGAGAALCSDTTYAAYDTTAHATVLRSITARGSTWDIGAFEFGQAGPSISPSTFPAGTVTQVYSQVLTPSGLSGTITWTRTSGTLPPGLSDCTGTGATKTLSGTLATAGSYSWTCHATDGTNTADDAITMTVNSAPAITTASPLPEGALGIAYSQTLTASPAGTTPDTWSVSTGAVPAGTSLSSAGVLSGTPTTITGSPFSFTARVTDANSIVSTKVFSLTIGTAPTLVTTSPLTVGTIGSAYSVQFAATGDTPITWTATGIPAGLSLSSGGLLSGTPTTAATSTIQVTATNAAGTQSGAPTGFSITVSAGLSSPHSTFSGTQIIRGTQVIK